MSLRIATWNVNSVRIRLALLQRLIEEAAPDVLCLQEIKVVTESFPLQFFHDLGYRHTAVAGQKGYHGVAILSRLPLEDTRSLDWCARGDARHIQTTLADGPTIHNFYVPAGGDIPDPEQNDKFAHKLQFLDEMTAWSSAIATTGAPVIMVGDFNVAPSQWDVWSHKQLLKIVSHTPPETDRLKIMQEAGEWVDAMRHFIPEPELIFTWWSYRARDWEEAGRGRRLDHIWVTPALAGSMTELAVLTHIRGWAKPSDHVPVILDLDI